MSIYKALQQQKIWLYSSVQECNIFANLRLTENISQAWQATSILENAASCICQYANKLSFNAAKNYLKRHSKTGGKPT
jgi:hypothetical protein